MLNNISFKVVYKYRFLPLFISGILLVIAIILKYALKTEIGSFLGWSIFLNIASFIYYRGVLETKNNKETKTEIERNPPPPPSNEEIKQIEKNEIEGAKKVQVQNIIFRSFHLLFAILLTLGGLSVAVGEKDINYFGVFIFVFGILACIFSIYRLRKWIRLYKFFKNSF